VPRAGTKLFVFGGGDPGIGFDVTLLRKVSPHRTRLRLFSSVGSADYDENRFNFLQQINGLQEPNPAV